MFDLAYERDVEIVDVEDPEPIARPRVATKDLTMRVHLDDGYFHRLHPSMLKTACGIPVNIRLHTPEAVRSIEHPLSPRGRCECWTSDEHLEADAAYRQRYGRDFRP